MSSFQQHKKPLETLLSHGGNLDQTFTAEDALISLNNVGQRFVVVSDKTESEGSNQRLRSDLPKELYVDKTALVSDPPVRVKM